MFQTDLEPSLNTLPARNEISEANKNVATSAKSAYSHSMIQVPGKEGAVVDTGAWENLSGKDAVLRQTKLAEQAGFQTTWTKMARPKYVSGVGDKAKQCTEVATIHGCLHNGRVIKYETPVIDGNEYGDSPLPTLYGLKSMSVQNTYFGTRNGKMVMIPEGKDDDIIWPSGTQVIQCEKAPSNHWILTTSNWEKIHHPQSS